MNALDFGVRFLMAALLASLWQIPIFAIIAWAVLRIAASANATTRHSVLAAALYASLILPVTTAGVAMHRIEAPPPVVVTIPERARTTLPLRHAPEPRRHVRRPGDAGAAPGTGARVRSGQTRLAAQTQERRAATLRPVLRMPYRLALIVAAVWFALAGTLLVRLVLSLVHLEALKRNALPVGVAYRERLPRWSAALKGGRDVRLCTSDAIDIPIAVGLFDAMILLPERLVAALPPDDVDAIVLHELAHLRRADDYINATERVALALLFFHPAISWIASRLDLEREVACDDWVVQDNAALPYATCLARLAEGAVWPHRAVPAPGAFMTRRGMSVRIERLLAKQRDVRVRTSFASAASAVVLIATCGLAGAAVAPSISYETQRISAEPFPRSAPPAPVVPRAFVEDLRAAGYADVPLDDLIALRALSVDGTYVRALRAAGLPHPSIVQLLRLRAVGVEPGFIAKLRRSRGGPPSIDDLVALRALGNRGARVGAVATQNVRESDRLLEMRARADAARALAEAARARAEATNDRASEAIAMAQAGTAAAERSAAAGAARGRGMVHINHDVLDVSGDYVRALAAAGLRSLSLDDVQALHALGVTPGYVRGLVNAGYDHLSVDDIARLQALGIDGAFIARAAKNGSSHPSLDDLVRLKVMGTL